MFLKRKELSNEKNKKEIYVDVYIYWLEFEIFNILEFQTRGFYLQFICGSEYIADLKKIGYF